MPTFLFIFGNKYLELKVVREFERSLHSLWSVEMGFSIILYLNF
ncbi:hypothetical protein ANHYDRO_01732 [Anaerococcus hydrogenalis DSM 7454]|uniref:Uncharacterized protein n=1 Tax=Anaerococcus hydrogenalis DSM 7454 TaxID=561177 RepID=B6WAL6_9FIRM|nr:hypothetical protein ANHYDRO_01732 [Anaerococcus hydrogenalis DSM 7454]